MYPPWCWSADRCWQGFIGLPRGARQWRWPRRGTSWRKNLNHEWQINRGTSTELATKDTRNMDSLKKCPSAFVVVPTGMGSFDYVRLTPHFAQDDRVCGDIKEKQDPSITTKDHHDGCTNDTKVAPRARRSAQQEGSGL